MANFMIKTPKLYISYTFSLLIALPIAYAAEVDKMSFS